jgi:glycosyltransferase involved in cell wall biosynthesis
MLDLQCCQTAAARRGMGRFSMSLARKVVQLGREHSFSVLLNARYPKGAGSVIEQLSDLLEPGAFVLFDYPSLPGTRMERRHSELAANILRNEVIQKVAPDIFHVSSLYEGESIFGTAPAYLSLPSLPTILKTVTAYDLIPLIFPSEYLTDKTYTEWFNETSAQVAGFDGLFCISEATKSDFVRQLGVPKHKAHVIYGAVDDQFQPRAARPHDPVIPREPFVLYVGGPDHRKNMRGLIEGYAHARAHVVTLPKLLVVCELESRQTAEMMAYARELELGDLVVFRGYVPDGDLVKLYQACELFVFPSLYEGLGLPVIEAMQCGAAVLAGNNSSLAEIVERPEYRFDAANPKAIGAALKETLSVPGRLEEMRSYSLRRARDFTWDKSAELLLKGWDAMMAARTPRAVPALPVRQRMAFFSPLPPAQTGIAAYSAELLEALSQSYDIDVYVDRPSIFSHAGINVRLHTEFVLSQHAYDVIVYQVGNSPFHWYMLKYMRDYPGVIVAHDAFTGFLYYEDFSHRAFWAAALAQNAPEAREVFERVASDADPIESAVALLPLSRELLDIGDAIIVHSAFAAEVLDAQASKATSARATIVPQLRKLEPERDSDERKAAKIAAGFGVNEFVVCTLGHVSPTKAPDSLIEGFLDFANRTQSDAKLVFVGPAEDGKRKELLEKVESQQRSRIQFTDHVDAQAYDRYLAAADVIVQLRTVTRGETSRAMLDALANGVPLISNRLGAAREFPDDVVVKIEGTGAAEVSRAIRMIFFDPALQSSLSRRAREYVSENLSPSAVARLYQSAIGDAKARRRAYARNDTMKSLAKLYRSNKPTNEEMTAVAAALERQRSPALTRRLLIDVTDIRQHDRGTGIQRQVRELTRALYREIEEGYLPRAVFFADGQWHFADAYAQATGAGLPFESSEVREDSVEFEIGDVLLMADGSWHLVDQMVPSLKSLYESGGMIVPVVCDLIPITRPELFPDYVEIIIRRFLAVATELSACMVCISETTAKRLTKHVVDSEGPVHPRLRIAASYCGADFSKGAAESTELFVGHPIAVGDRPFLLVVGTIEPRKGHLTIIEAFSKLWSAGHAVDLVLVGKLGWASRELLESISDHDELGSRLILAGFVHDSVLTDLYKRCSGVILGSVDEGFGLPIYEAARFGPPLILSDIEIFREIAGDAATYFEVGNPDSLAAVILQAVAQPLTPSSGLKPISWRESAARLVSVIKGLHTYYQVN